MKLSRRSIILVCIVIVIYTFLIGSFVSTRSFSYLFKGPSDAQLGIQTLSINSPYQKHQNLIKVLVPDNMIEGEQYPVLYILPVSVGLWDDLWINGIREAARNNIHNKYQVICVYPSYERMPWYGDHPSNQSIQQESHLVKSVIPFVDKHFSTIAEGRGRMLIGFSKSGWGAFSLLLRYPHLFGKAASFDAPLMFDDIYQWGSGLKEVFGNEENFNKYFLPEMIVRRKALLQKKHPQLVLMGYAFIEDHTRQMHAYLKDWDIPHLYDLRKWERHTWESGWFPEAVKLLMKSK